MSWANAAEQFTTALALPAGGRPLQRQGPWALRLH